MFTPISDMYYRFPRVARTVNAVMNSIPLVKKAWGWEFIREVNAISRAHTKSSPGRRNNSAQNLE